MTTSSLSVYCIMFLQRVLKVLSNSCCIFLLYSIIDLSDPNLIDDAIVQLEIEISVSLLRMLVGLEHLFESISSAIIGSPKEKRV